MDNTWDSASISLGVCMDKDDTGNATVNLTDSVIDRNYVYRPQDEEHYRAGRHAGSCSDWLTTEEFNLCYSTTNYHKPYNAEDPLHQGTSGANAYKTGTLISGDDWANAVTITVPFTASAPGSTEWLTAPVFYTGGSAYFALKS